MNIDNVRFAKQTTQKTLQIKTYISCELSQFAVFFLHYGEFYLAAKRLGLVAKVFYESAIAGSGCTGVHIGNDQKFHKLVSRYSLMEAIMVWVLDT